MKFTTKVDNYRVEKWTADGDCYDCGNLTKNDVKRMLAGYKYDEAMDMYFTPAANKAIYIEKA